MFTLDKMLYTVIKADKAVLAGTRLKDIQVDLRQYECCVDNDSVLAERFEAACYSRTRDKTMIALIHCTAILRRKLGVII